MKNKIAYKLTLYFSITLILFSLIIGSVFMILFKNNTLVRHKEDLENRAGIMASNLSEYMSENSELRMMGNRQGGYGAYIRFLDDIAMSDVWIVDENLELITNIKRENQQFNYADLPQDAEGVVRKVFQGQTTFSEGFSKVLNTNTLTVGTPIKSGEVVVGALLLHSPVEGMENLINQGFKILSISVGIALALSILLSILLAMVFTKPLKKMKNTAIQLAEGDYSVKTGVQQKDEIGELASKIDILSEQLQIASRESEQLLTLRREFVANISHELRTPVTVIRGSLEALYDGVVTDPKQVKSYHLQMLNESMYLQRLVNDLLDLSRLQNTDFKMEMQELNLGDVLDDVVRSARHMATLKNIEIIQDKDEQLCIVSGDYGRLRQMFLIILDNAIKFSQEGGRVTLSLKNRVVSIVDYGIGIPKMDIPYIFDRFYRTNVEKNKKGTGLGLAIAKQIADRHNVHVSVSSEEDQGAGFTFRFF